MGKRVSISQPTYLPWLGYFDLIAQSDVFVFLDHVQFERRSWQCRNRLKASSGDPFWLSVPLASHKRETRIQEMLIDPNQSEWNRKHLQSIRTCLASAPFFDEVFPHLEAWLLTEYSSLSEMTIDGVTRFAALLNIKTELVRSSEIGVTGAKADLMVSILQALGAESYRANAGSREYTEAAQDSFQNAGISVSYQDWEHPVYAQAHGEFVSHLAFPDALCHLGLTKAQTLFQQPAN